MVVFACTVGSSTGSVHGLADLNVVKSETMTDILSRKKNWCFTVYFGFLV